MNGFHLLAKPTGAICNLDCTYCFFLSKEMLYPGSRFRMADDLLETYIRQLIDAHAGAPEVTVAWQGGEPTLMGVDFFRRSLEHQRSACAAGAAGGQHDPNEWHVDRRRMGEFLPRERLPGRHLDRRAARLARCLPGRQGRQADLRPGDGRAGPLAAPRGGLERADHGARRQRGARPGRLPISARRLRRFLRPVHPDRRADDIGADRVGGLQPEAAAWRQTAVRAVGQGGHAICR